MTAEPEPQGDGDCFIVAARWVVQHPEWTLVHGRPRARGGPWEGRRYWHAWVERSTTHEMPGWPHPITVTVVMDRSNGGDVEVPQQLYYKLGDLEDEPVLRYDSDGALHRMMSTGHFGPWEEVVPMRE